jgi:plastocyanin
VTPFSFALRRSAIITAILSLGLVLAACSNGSEESAAPETSAPATNGGGSGASADLTITAADMVFDTDTLTAPAGEEIVVTFTNNDAVPHNFSVYTEEGGEAIATGDIINEGETDEVELGTLEPGTYYFVCDLHPEMNGSFVVEG